MYCVLTFTLQFSSVLVEIRGFLGASRVCVQGYLFVHLIGRFVFFLQENTII